ncbi:hypothetical protein [Ammonifex degensii]|uniref:hypothetical protein n=1 Tax=Ammonifex degensii TaxID=42838 RepID=UPI00030D6636|nr:hypothetical protein [Ammonifex degensii]
MRKKVKKSETVSDLLIGLEEDQLEETIRLIRQVRAQMAVSRMRERARALGLDKMSNEDIEAEIHAVTSSHL